MGKKPSNHISVDRSMEMLQDLHDLFKPLLKKKNAGPVLSRAERVEQLKNNFKQRHYMNQIKRRQK
jgi:hypothetical protein